MKNLLQVLFLFFTPLTLMGQDNYYLIDTTGIDILNVASEDSTLLSENLALFHNSTEDTVKLNCINALSEKLYSESTWPLYNELLLELSQQYLSKGNLKEEEIHLFKASRATAYNNRGYVSNSKGRLKEALDNYLLALKMHEEIGDEIGVSTCLNNISLVYFSQGDMEKSLEMLEQALKIRVRLKDKAGEALYLVNIGGMQEELGNPEKALECYEDALKISNDLDDEVGSRQALNSLGVIYGDKEDFDLSFEYLNKVLEINKSLGDKDGIAQSLSLIAGVYIQFNDFGKAQKYAEESFVLCEELGFPHRIQRASQLLNLIYSKQQKWKKAHAMFTLSTKMLDSLDNDNLGKEIFKKQVQFDYEKKEQEIQHAHEKELAISIEREKVAEENEKRQKLMSMAIGGGLLLVLIIAGIISRSYFQKKKSNIKLEEMNDELNHSNLLITESIDYAKRIQNSILPPVSAVHELFPDSFVYFNPKDIVSGDFYWMHKEGDDILFAVADCTGHGVPGAFMSIVSNNILNNITSKGILAPNLILAEMGGMLIERLRQRKGDNSIQDGLDISIARFNTKTKKLCFAGAHNSMYLVRNKEIIEFKADRIHIGISGNDNNIFTNHEVEIQPMDMVYLFTDGYPDQKGGENGKKFFYGPFRDLLIEISDEKAKDQKNKLETTMLDWSKGEEQIDDMLILGVKF